jgi:hypothetical protein
MDLSLFCRCEKLVVRFGGSVREEKERRSRYCLENVFVAMQYCQVSLSVRHVTKGLKKNVLKNVGV